MIMVICMKKCPHCGNKMDDNQRHCLTCDYVEKRGKDKYCPVCDELLIKDVCYKCGYRGGKASNTCPYCRQKLVAGRCDRCNYVKPFFYASYRIKRIALVIFLLIILAIVRTLILL